jgi:hypothetical protein
LRPRVELHPFEIDRETYIAVMRTEMPRQYRRWLIGIAALLAVFVAKIAWDASSFVGFAIASAPMLVYTAFWCWLAWWWIPVYLARSPKNRFQFCTYRITLSEGRLEVEQSNGASSLFPLDQIVGIRTQKAHLLLYVSLLTLLIIPRSAFKSREDEVAFEAALAEATTAA